MDSQALPVPDPHGAARRGEERPYARRKPEASDLYQIVQQELETFLAGASARELRAFLRCGILAHGFVRVVAFSRKKVPGVRLFFVRLSWRVSKNGLNS